MPKPICSRACCNPPPEAPSQQHEQQGVIDTITPPKKNMDLLASLADPFPVHLNLAFVCLDRRETAARMAEGVFNSKALAAMADEYGTKATQALAVPHPLGAGR